MLKTLGKYIKDLRVNVCNVQKKILFAGGGTGGHLFPAIAIADEIKRKHSNVEIVFVGTKGKIEANVVPKAGYKFHSVWISGFHRKKIFKNLLLPIKILVSMIQSLLLLRRYKPSVVVGTGGYVSAPVIFSAALLKIPTLIHDQDYIPGKTTQFLSRYVNEVHVSFNDSQKYFHRCKKVFVSGNPIRDTLKNSNIEEALKYFGFSIGEHKKTILIFGGSLGAHSINNAICNGIERLLKTGHRIIWQTGKNDYEWVQKQCGVYNSSNLWIGPFIERMEYAYALSTIVVCRAGATTIAELMCLGKPAILIPYPLAASDHQTANARYLADAGAALLIQDNEVGKVLVDAICELLSNEKRLNEMALASKSLGRPNAAVELADRIIDLASFQT